MRQKERRKEMFDTPTQFNVSFFVGEKSRIKDGLLNRGITANNMINVETLSDGLDPFVRVWYRT